MKKIFISIILVFCYVVAKTQDCTYYIPEKAGTTIETKSYNAKDKLTGSGILKVLESTSNKVKFSVEAFDNKGKSVANGDYEVKCENGRYIIDMGQYLQGVNKNSYKDMDIKIESKDMSLPAKLEAGQTLDDGEIKFKVSNQVMTVMSMTTKILNRKVEATEDITTPAGTFKCAKITYDVESKTMFTVKSKGIEYITPKIGVVRSETYDTKGKLQGYTIITAIN